MLEEHLELVAPETRHGRFDVWRSSTDFGGAWHLAEIGVVLQVDALEEVTAAEKLGGQPKAALKCTFSAVDRVRILQVRNPQEWAERGAALELEVEAYGDRDPDADLSEPEARVARLLNEAVTRGPGTTFSAPGVGLSAKRDSFWSLIGVWCGYLMAKAAARKLQDLDPALLAKIAKAAPGKGGTSRMSMVNVGELPQALQNEIQASLKLSIFDRSRLDDAPPCSR